MRWRMAARSNVASRLSGGTGWPGRMRLDFLPMDQPPEPVGKTAPPWRGLVSDHKAGRSIPLLALTGAGDLLSPAEGATLGLGSAHAFTGRRHRARRPAA